MLTETIEAARRDKVVKAKSFEKSIIDTTVMEKAVAYPTDSRLLERSRQHLEEQPEMFSERRHPELMSGRELRP